MRQGSVIFAFNACVASSAMRVKSTASGSLSGPATPINLQVSASIAATPSGAHGGQHSAVRTNHCADVRIHDSTLMMRPRLCVSVGGVVGRSQEYNGLAGGIDLHSTPTLLLMNVYFRLKIIPVAIREAVAPSGRETVHVNLPAFLYSKCQGVKACSGK